MSPRRLTSYSDVLPLLENLQFAVTEARRRDGMSLRDLADATTRIRRRLTLPANETTTGAA